MVVVDTWTGEVVRVIAAPGDGPAPGPAPKVNLTEWVVVGATLVSALAAVVALKEGRK